MKIINLNIDENILYEDELAICLGYFDGLHKGHIKLFQKAKESIYKSAVLILSKNAKRDDVLLPIQEKILQLDEFGIDYAFILEFNNDIKEMSKEDFINKILIKINAKEVIVGKDYAFGKNRQGAISDLKMCKAFKTSIIPFVRFQGEKVSTTLLYDLLDHGDIQTLNKLMLNKYQIKFKINKNKVQFSNNYHMPKNGIYKIKLCGINIKINCEIKIHNNQIIFDLNTIDLLKENEEYSLFIKCLKDVES